MITDLITRDAAQGRRASENDIQIIEITWQAVVICMDIIIINPHLIALEKKLIAASIVLTRGRLTNLIN